MKLLVLRPAAGAAATVERGRAAGHAVIATPLFVYRALSWTPPPADRYDALLFTSAAAVRFGGPALDLYRALPVQAVGIATADAVRNAGFDAVNAGTGDAQAALAALAARGHVRILHPAGRDHVAALHPGLRIDRIPVYAADPVAALPPAALSAIDDDAIVLLHSPRAAAIFVDRLHASGGGARGVRIACFSAAVARAAGPGWSAVAIAAHPTDEALFAAAAGLCDQDADRPVEPR